MNRTPSIEAMKEWSKLRCVEEAYYWHQKYTPWFTKEQLMEICKLYNKEDFRRPIDDIDSLPVSEFERLMIKQTRMH